MPTGQLHNVLDHIRRLAPTVDGGMTDGQLLEQFLTQQDETAFEALLRRHGPMVLCVCRRLLRHQADAEDAFQATFLVLVRKARSIVSREKVGNWLHGVAHHTARRLRDANARRRAKEKQVEQMPQSEVPTRQRSDLAEVLDEELEKLPEKYRVPIVLCDLESRSRKEVAGQLKLAEGTLSSRLARGRALLAQRLSKRGMALSGGALTAVLSQGVASASVPRPLAYSTVTAARQLAAGQAVTSLVSARVAVLVEGAIKTMLLKKLKLTVGLVVLFGLFALTFTGQATPAAKDPSSSGVLATDRQATGKTTVIPDQQNVAVDDEKNVDPNKKTVPDKGITGTTPYGRLRFLEDARQGTRFIGLVKLRGSENYGFTGLPITRETKFTLDGKPCRLEDLLPGMRAVVKYHSDATSMTLLEVNAELESEAEFTLHGVDLKGKLLALTVAGTHAPIFHLPLAKDARIRHEGSDVELEKLRPRSRVRLMMSRGNSEVERLYIDHVPAK